MARADLLREVVERAVLAEHDGRSGAGLERVRLADGRALVVKRVTPESDLTLAMTGGTVAWEYLLWRAGVLDRLPEGLSHAIVDAWLEEDATVIVMRDLGDRVLGFDDRMSHEQTMWMLERLARMHRRFLGEPLPDLAPLDLVLGLFAPHRIRPLAEQGVELLVLALRGWEIFAETVDPSVAEPVLALLEDMTPLSEALGKGPLTLAHGDLATVNMAIEGDDLVLLDWSLPVAAPGWLDVARFLSGCASMVAASREEVLARYQRAAGPSHDEHAMRLSLLAGLVWLGWNKALDAVEHPDPAKRRMEQQDLNWWVDQARRTFESGAL